MILLMTALLSPPLPSSPLSSPPQVTSIVHHILERKAEENAECWPQIRVEEIIPTLVKWAESHDSHMTVT